MRSCRPCLALSWMAGVFLLASSAHAQQSSEYLVRTLTGHRGAVYAVAFSPDGAYLASGSFDETVRLWRVSDGALLRTLNGHTGSVLSVAFSPDGAYLASGSADRTVRLVLERVGFRNSHAGMQFEEDRRMNSEVTYIPAGKIRCYVTGELRDDKPEEHVRQRVARSLVEEYGYPKEDLALEFRINVGRARKRVDIAVFAHGQPHAQENIFLIAETKRENVKPADRDNGVGQLKSYLAASFNAKWGLWVGSELQAYEVVVEGGERKPVDVADIPPYGKTQAPRITFDQLVATGALGVVTTISTRTKVCRRTKRFTSYSSSSSARSTTNRVRRARCDLT